MLLLLNKGCSIKKRRIWLVSPKIQLRLRLKHLVVIVTTDHKNIHFDLFLIPKHHSITNNYIITEIPRFFEHPLRNMNMEGKRILLMFSLFSAYVVVITFVVDSCQLLLFVWTSCSGVVLLSTNAWATECCDNSRLVKIFFIMKGEWSALTVCSSLINENYKLFHKFDKLSSKGFCQALSLSSLFLFLYL